MTINQTPDHFKKVTPLSEITRNTCERILALEDFNIYMPAFKKDHECGTSYCIAGRLAFLNGYPDEFKLAIDSNGKYEFSYDAYSSSLVEKSGIFWSWLFDASWPNSLDHAKQRASYLIKHGAVPHDFKLLRTEGEFMTYPVPN